MATYAASSLVLASACAQGEPAADPIDPTQPPVQEGLATGAGVPHDAPIDHDGAHFTARARYRIAARVLGAERYYWGWEADAVPLDLALGWGAMADPRVDEWIDWHQGDRWYFWQWDAGSPYRNEQIREASANVHIVPGTKNLRRALLALDRGDVVQLEGFLVDVAGPDGEGRTTSLSRTDTGSNACEILYTTKLVAHGKAYR